MPTPRAQTIWDALVTRLQTITTANGYNTAIGSKVDEWRHDYQDVTSSELPRLNVQDGQTTDNFEQLPHQVMHTMTVQVEGFVTASTAAATADALRSLDADIRKCLVSGSAWEGATNWGGGNVHECRITQVERAVGQAESFLGQVVVTIEIDYLTSNFDPYTAG